MDSSRLLKRLWMKQQPNKICFKGLGTYWECEVLFDIPVSKSEGVRILIEQELVRFSNSYSRFEKDSLISRLNQKKALEYPPLELIEMLDFAREMFEVSEGYFNISVGGRLNALGYGGQELYAFSDPNFWQKVIISEDKIVIPDQSVIDFGGFGKGWLIDRFANIFRQNSINEFIVNGGGDLFVQSQQPIEIVLEHPLDPSKKIGQTWIKNGSLAASSTLKRAWVQNEVLHNHIINPKDDKSMDGSIIGSFVKADRALIADAIATILIIKPELESTLSKKYDLKVILLNRDQFKS